MPAARATATTPVPATTVSRPAVVIATTIAPGTTARPPRRRLQLRAAARSKALHKQVLAKELKNVYLFGPKSVKIKVGTTITWSNTSDAEHNVTFDKNSKVKHGFQSEQIGELHLHEGRNLHLPLRVSPLYEGDRRRSPLASVFGQGATSKRVAPCRRLAIHCAPAGIS